MNIFDLLANFVFETLASKSNNMIRYGEKQNRILDEKYSDYSSRDLTDEQRKKLDDSYKANQKKIDDTIQNAININNKVTQLQNNRKNRYLILYNN